VRQHQAAKRHHAGAAGFVHIVSLTVNFLGKDLANFVDLGRLSSI